MLPSFRNSCAVTAVILASAVLIASPIGAKVATGERSDVWTLTVDDQPEGSIRQGNRWIGEGTGVPVAIAGVGYPVSPDLPEAMARQYLSENAMLLGLGSDRLEDLEAVSTWESPAGWTVRFRQTLEGLPVDRADLAVTINRAFEVSFVSSGYRPGLALSAAAATISEAAARAGALGYLGIDGPVTYERTRLMVHAIDRAARLVWQTRAVPAGSPTGDWEVLTDASTGEIFKVVDRAIYVDGDGGTFDPDPLSTAGATYNDPGFVDGNDADTPQLVGEILDVVLRDLTLSGGMHHLSGPYAEVLDFEAPFKGVFSQPGSTFDFTRTEDAFEAVVGYYHVDNIMRWIDLDLGLDIGPYQYSGGVQFDPHGLSGADNSHYITSTGRMAFGEGGVDDAEDADVLIHELGHGLHDWVTGGHLSQVNGLSEGYGDYIAASYSRSLGLWQPSDPAYDWVFVWDGHNPFWPGRVTNYGGHYPEDLTGSIHTDGQIWSTCNMLIWDQIGRDQTDRAILVGLGMTGSGTNQEQAAAAVLQAATDLGYPAAEIATMQTIYNGCGYDVGAPPAGLTLSVVGTCPGTIDISVTGATPNGPVSLYFGSSAGSTTLLNGPCAGTDLDLAQPRGRGRFRADVDGVVETTMSVPAGACGRPMQVLDGRSCGTSNTVQVP